MNKTTKVILATIMVATTTLGYNSLKAQADTIKPSVVVIDTALDTSIPVLKNRIAQEICAMEWNLCPNLTGLQEGPGSSGLAMTYLKTDAFSHGTQMSSVVASLNPNVNIIFIRIVGITKDGYRASTTDASVVKALDWVVANQSKYNIASVAMSQGNHDIATYNVSCKNNVLSSDIDKLKALNIPVMFPAGNSYDTTRVDYPACIPQTIAVGATDKFGSIALYSNGSPTEVDFYALGTMNVTNPGNTVVAAAGTSISVQVAATNWATVKIAKPNLNYDQVYSLLKQTATPTSNSKIKGGYLINIEKAIK
jgi:hypothetical protein